MSSAILLACGHAWVADESFPRWETVEFARLEAEAGHRARCKTCASWQAITREVVDTDPTVTLPGVTVAEAEANAARLGAMLRQFGEEYEAATGSRPTVAVTASPEAARVARYAGFRVVDPTSPRRGRLSQWWDRRLSSALGTPGRQVEDRSDYGMGQ